MNFVLTYLSTTDFQTAEAETNLLLIVVLWRPSAFM